MNSSARAYIPNDDAETLKPDSIIRLKDLCNITITSINPKDHTINATYTGKARIKKSGISKIQWVPGLDNVEIQVLMPDGSLIRGLGESTCKELKIDQIVHFERFGLGRVNEIESNIMIFYAHK